MSEYDLSDPKLFPKNPNALDLKPEPKDRKLLGKLIIDLALGLRTIPAGATRDKIVTILSANGLDVPDDVDIEFYYRTPDKLMIMIPPRDMVIAALRRYQNMDKNNDIYNDLPPEYAEMINGTWKKPDKTIEQFYEIRVSDYTLSYCR